MKLSPILIAASVFALGVYAIGQAQTSERNSIELGNTVLHVGMARDSAIAALATAEQRHDADLLRNRFD